MDKDNAVKMVEVCKVSPSSNHSSKFSLSLSAFDWIFMKFPPIQRVFYYPISHLDSDSDSDSFFHSILIPNLKHSLSLTLNHFLPLAGNLLWPEDSPLPFILYAPNDAVPFTVVETNSDFHHLSGKHPREIKDSQPLIPTIQSSDTSTPMMAIQVTHFPNQGFSIGLAFHHVLFDGLSFSLFFKSWAHICKLIEMGGNNNQLDSPLPPELAPSFERGANVLQDPFDFVPQDRSLNYDDSLSTPPPNWLRASFELTPTHIQKLKKRALEETVHHHKTSSSPSEVEELHLSTFVVAYAYVLMCMIKAKQEECREVVYITVAADVRGRLDPPLSSNYFGNCITHLATEVEARDFPNIANTISHLILDFRRTRQFKATKPSDLGRQWNHNFVSRVELFSVAASPKYRLYEADFGWGNPNRAEIASLGKNNISFTDTRDGGRGLEVALLLPDRQMHAFASLFAQGLN